MDHDPSQNEESMEEMFKDFEKAGEIAGEIKKEIRKLVIPGQSVLDIVETLEKMIVDKGGGLAFPVNVCINNIAAHFTPPSDYDGLIEEDALVKIDFGVHVNGCISDNALTIDLTDEHGKLVEAAESALESASASV